MFRGMNPQDFGLAYESCFQQTVRLLSSKGASQQNATEIAQAAWVRGFEKRDQLFSPDCVGVWVNSIAVNLLRDELRRPETGWPMSLEVAYSANVVHRAIVTEMLGSCGKRDAQLLKRRYVDGYSMREIAAFMNLDETSVRVRLHRLRRKLLKRTNSPSKTLVG